MKYHININAGIGYPISKAYVEYLLRPLQGKHCDVRISSYGGETFTALDIRQQFRDHGDVTCYIYGMTASAATILAMGAKTIKMSRFALMLIHRNASLVGDWQYMNVDKLAERIKDLSAMKDQLHTADDVIANLYALRTGKSAGEMLNIMKKEEWLTADRCLELGLIDEIIEDGDKPKLSAEARDLLVSNHIPLPPDNSFDDAEEPHGLKKFMNDLYGFFTARSEQSVVEQLQQICDGRAATPSQTEDPEPKADKPETETPLTNTQSFDMKKLTNLAALLAVTALATNEDGSISLTAEQLQTIEGKLGDLTAQNQDLTAQVEALKKSDGDETKHLENSGKEEHDTDVEDARSMYNEVKNLIPN